MRTFRFKILAHTEVDILAKDLNEARKQADIEWHKIFKNGLFGEVEFIKEIKENKDHERYYKKNNINSKQAWKFGLEED